MPFIYTSQALEGRAMQSPEYTKRGLTAWNTGKLEELFFVGVASEKQLAYDAYEKNLPAFLYATQVQKKVYVKNLYYGLSIPLSDLIPFPLPPLCLASRTALKTDQDKEKMRNKFSIPVENLTYNKQPQYLVRNYTLDDFASFPLADIDANTPSPNDATSLLGLQGFLTTLKIVTLFLATHTYPAFSSPEQTNSSFVTDSELCANSGYYNPLKTSRFAMEEYVEEDEGYRAKEMSVVANADVRSSHKNTFDASFQSMITVAKPAPFYPAINYGPPTAVPNLPGFVFPYFRGMIHPSFDSAINVMRRYFINALGSTDESNSAAWQTWCKNLRRWHRTDAGMSLCHVLFGIQTALEAQARFFLVIHQGSYLGFTILGYKFTITRQSIPLVPDTADQVQKLVKGLDRHTDAVTKICAKLSLMNLKSSESEEPVTNVQSSRELWHEINRRKPFEKEALKELEGLVAELTFEDRYWPMTIDKIKLALTSIIADTTPEGIPMYLAPECIYDTSHAFSILSAFGPMAPSFIDAGGREIILPKGLDAEDPMSVPDPVSKKRPVESILVTGKKLPVAVGDMKHVMKKRTIRQNPSERAAGYRTLRFTGEGREILWNVLKQVPFQKDQDKGKKRAREEDDDAADGPSTKKKGPKEQFDSFGAFSF